METGFDFIKQTLLFFVQRPRFGDDALPPLIGKTQHPVHQIAPIRHQFVIHAFHKIVPGKVHIVGFRRNGGQRIAPGVGLVAFEHVQDADNPSLAFAELPPVHIQVFVGRHIIGQIQALVANQHCRPHHGMKGNIVLADKIIDMSLGVGIGIPPLPPLFRVAVELGPLFCRTQIADNRVVPDIDTFPVRVRQRNGHAPLHVAGDRTATQFRLFDLGARKMDDVRTPVRFAVLQPGSQRFLEFRQIQEVMLSLADFEAGIPGNP